MGGYNSLNFLIYPSLTLFPNHRHANRKSLKCTFLYLNLYYTHKFFLQIWSKGLQLLTNAPLPRFLGGDIIEESSNKREISKLFLINLCICMSINMMQLLVKALQNQKFALSYLDNMRVNLINNFLDVFGSKRALICLVLMTLFMISQQKIFSLAASGKPYLFSLSFQTLGFIPQIITYSGHPPR